MKFQSSKAGSSYEVRSESIFIELEILNQTHGQAVISNEQTDGHRLTEGNSCNRSKETDDDRKGNRDGQCLGTQFVDLQQKR